MGILPESHVSRLKADLAKMLVNPVKVIVFTQEIECEYCKETRELVDEISSLTDKIKLQVLDLVKDKEKAAEYGVDKVPAIVIEGSKKSNVKFYGVPAGYEFNTLIKDIVLASRGETELTAETKRRLSEHQETRSRESIRHTNLPLLPRNGKPSTPIRNGEREHHLRHD